MDPSNDGSFSEGVYAWVDTRVTRLQAPTCPGRNATLEGLAHPARVNGSVAWPLRSMRIPLRQSATVAVMGCPARIIPTAPFSPSRRRMVRPGTVPPKVHLS
jgi:hypothetical protein